MCALGSRYVPRQVWMLRHDGLMLSESAEQGQHRPRGKVRGGPGGVPFRRRSRVRRPEFHTMLHLSIAAPQLARALPLASRAPGTVGGTTREPQGEVQEPLRPNLQVPPPPPPRPRLLSCNCSRALLWRDSAAGLYRAGLTVRASMLQEWASFSACNQGQEAVLVLLWMRWSRAARRTGR